MDNWRYPKPDWYSDDCSKNSSLTIQAHIQTYFARLDYERLRSENERLQEENKKCEANIEQLREENDRLREEVSQLNSFLSWVKKKLYIEKGIVLKVPRLRDELDS